MCRSIKILRNIEPQASDTEVREAAKQFVRKISGYRHPPGKHRSVRESCGWHLSYFPAPPRLPGEPCPCGIQKYRI